MYTKIMYIDACPIMREFFTLKMREYTTNCIVCSGINTQVVDLLLNDNITHLVLDTSNVANSKGFLEEFFNKNEVDFEIILYSNFITQETINMLKNIDVHYIRKDFGVLSGILYGGCYET